LASIHKFIETEITGSYKLACDHSR